MEINLLLTAPRSHLAHLLATFPPLLIVLKHTLPVPLSHRSWERGTGFLKPLRKETFYYFFILFFLDIILLLQLNTARTSSNFYFYIKQIISCLLCLAPPWLTFAGCVRNKTLQSASTFTAPNLKMLAWPKNNKIGKINGTFCGIWQHTKNLSTVLVRVLESSFCPDCESRYVPKVVFCIQEQRTSEMCRPSADTCRRDLEVQWHQWHLSLIKKRPPAASPLLRVETACHWRFAVTPKTLPGPVHVLRSRQSRPLPSKRVHIIPRFCKPSVKPLQFTGFHTWCKLIQGISVFGVFLRHFHWQRKNT